MRGMMADPFTLATLRLRMFMPEALTFMALMIGVEAPPTTFRFSVALFRLRLSIGMADVPTVVPEAMLKTPLLVDAPVLSRVMVATAPTFDFVMLPEQLTVPLWTA